MDTARWMPWRPRRLLVTAAARTIASWDAVVRLPARAHLLWLAQQITEARTTAQATLDPPEAAPPACRMSSTSPLRLSSSRTTCPSARSNSPTPCARPAVQPGNWPPPRPAQPAARSHA
ncbi:hypothetical protein ACIQGT_26205 [Streptomyces sp. NPDC093108]|uniref:hypothetical protein n=1 Tax=Streptomyces sp. NPDC093108 TaxID=3366030 RepID=UPI0038105F63